MVVREQRMNVSVFLPEVVFVDKNSHTQDQLPADSARQRSRELLSELLLTLVELLFLLDDFSSQFGVVFECRSEVTVDFRLHHQTHKRTHCTQTSHNDKRYARILLRVGPIPEIHHQPEQEVLQVEKHTEKHDLAQEQVDPFVAQLNHRQSPDALGLERNERQDSQQGQQVEQSHEVEVVGESGRVKLKCVRLRRVILDRRIEDASRRKVVPCGVGQGVESEERQLESALVEEEGKVGELAQHGHFQSDEFFGEDTDHKGRCR